jgi:hypothetical protein
MIITMKIPSITEPQRGEINATPSGLVNRSMLYFYNLFTPSGLVNHSMLYFYNLFTPSGLVSQLYNPNTPLMLKF